MWTMHDFVQNGWSFLVSTHPYALKLFKKLFTSSACRLTNVSGSWLNVYIKKEKEQKMFERIADFIRYDIDWEGVGAAIVVGAVSLTALAVWIILNFEIKIF